MKRGCLYLLIKPNIYRATTICQVQLQLQKIHPGTKRKTLTSQNKVRAASNTYKAGKVSGNCGNVGTI